MLLPAVRKHARNGAFLTALVWLVAEVWGVLAPARGDTLSEWVWDSIGTRFDVPWYVTMGALAGLAVWAWWHFGWGFPGVRELLVLLVSGGVIGAALYFIR